MNLYPKWIHQRTFGGSDTAVVASVKRGNGDWPEGRSAPFSKLACDRLVEACKGSNHESSAPVFVFLVGGAGNGKSLLAQDVVHKISAVEHDESNVAAQRTYEYPVAGGRQLTIVNDATIPPEEEQGSTPLMNDIDRVLRDGGHMLACVNRGILVSEMASDERPESTGKEICQRLMGDAGSDDAGKFYSTFTFRRDVEGEVEIHVVYMDHLSLLEPWPDEPESLGAPNGTLALKLRLVGQDRFVDDRRVVFAPLISEFSSKVSASLPQGSLNPLSANVLSLSIPRAANGWCSILRGAEVVGGSHFTYRELWALACYSVIGPANPRKLDEFFGTIGSLLATAKEEPSSIDFSIVKFLAGMRTHMLMFSGGKIEKAPSQFTEFIGVSKSPALDLVQAADPLKEFGASDGSDHKHLLSQLASIEQGEDQDLLPVARLAEEDDDVGAYWTEFDRFFEAWCGSVLSNRIVAPSAAVRREVLSFYGKYMFRLVGVARGWPAHMGIVSEWQEAWMQAQNGNVLPSNLDQGLRNLILPAQGQEIPQFPALSPRVSMAGKDNKIRVVVRSDGLNIRAATLGAGIEFRLLRNDQRVAGGLFDFHLTREILARSQGNDSGFSDSYRLVEPRLERIRAGMLNFVFSSGLANEAEYKV